MTALGKEQQNQRERTNAVLTAPEVPAQPPPSNFDRTSYRSDFSGWGTENQSRLMGGEAIGDHEKVSARTQARRSNGAHEERCDPKHLRFGSVGPTESGVARDVSSGFDPSQQGPFGFHAADPDQCTPTSQPISQGSQLGYSTVKPFEKQ